MTSQGPHGQAEADNDISGSLKSMFALSEAYPDLKANTNFLNLQGELSGTEGRIAYARQFYNDTVYRYNTKIETFPANTIAKRFRFTERAYFEAAGEERNRVDVDFGSAPPVDTGGPTPPPAATVTPRVRPGSAEHAPPHHHPSRLRPVARGRRPR